ncbi:MAG: hypothetical protein JSR72_11945 [Proteobacteria bacterium]|nr:hypothetical protein [Pseudomonadota bacterium]
MAAAFAGIVTFDDELLDARSEQAIMAAAAGPGRQRVASFRAANGFIAQRTGAPNASTARSLLFAADVRLDNRDELRAALGDAGPARTDDAGLLLAMIARFGDAGIARCLGAFAFAQWQADERRLLLGRDCLGHRSLFYHRGDGFVAFATTLGGLLALPRVPRQLDDIALANFLAINLNASEETLYRGVVRVPSRCVVDIDRRGAARRHYWSPRRDDAGKRRDGDYVEEARARFDEAVLTVSRDLPRLAVSCSGGLDSSAIAATLARLGHAQSIDCYTIVPPPGSAIDVGERRYYDETDKVEALAARYPALNLHLMSPPAPHPYESDPTRIFARSHMPYPGPTVLGGHGALYDAVAAAAYPALIAGDAGNLCLTWEGRFSIRALLREGRWRELAHELSAIGARKNRNLARTVFAEVVLGGAPLWLRRVVHRMRGRDPDAVERYSALNPVFIADNDLARQWREQAFEAWPLPVGWDAAQFRARGLFDINQMGRDLKAASVDVFGYERRDPYADRRLIEFALNVPERLYRRDGVDRAFARAVFADRLPPEILNEQRRGISVAAWFQRLDARRHDLGAELERLEASATARRLIDLKRLKGMVEDWPADADEARVKRNAYIGALQRAMHVGHFIRWVEGANA